MMNIGIPGLILILIIVLVVFGPSKLPQLGRAFGETVREFRKSTKEVVDEATDEIKIEEKAKKEQK